MFEKKVILTAHGERMILAKMFGCSLVTVRDALSGRRDTDLCKRIRKAAMERGGAVSS